jgi:thiopeptide-type bacteriocin biosynthesis protein
VPLVEALDEEWGVGAALVPGGDRDASPLLRDLEFPAAGPETIDWGRRDQALLSRVGQALLAGHHELALTERDLEEMANNEAPTLPDAYAAMATVISRDPQPNASGDFRVLLHDVFGPSGATLLGRFCHADPELSSRVQQHLRDEAALDPDALYAEIVHLPEGRVGNVLLRPVLRQYEIPYLGRSGASGDHQIPVMDLTISVSGDRFILRSRRLARRIVPRLTSAHNFTRLSLNVYRFLCLLQSDGRLAGCTWTWGMLGALPFLPRITCGRFVFSLATWRVTNDDLAPLKAASAGVAQYEAVQTWRAARRLPRWVALADYDNTLPVDLDNALAVDALVHLLKNRERATLTEIFPGPNDLCAQSDDGRYVHELVIPWARAPREGAIGQDITPPAQNEDAPTIRRTFPPGSEWIYAKLYSGPAAADRVLTDIIGPVSRALLAKSLIDRWWFIRYADPDPHLRWRLRRTATTRATTIQRRIETAAASLIGRGLVRQLMFDTYEREVERYGGAMGVDAAEQYFWADSEAVLDELTSLGDDDADADTRWRLAIPGVDTLLRDLGLDLDAKLRLAQRLRERFGREFHADAAFGRQLAPKYRSVRADLERLIATGGAADADRPWREALARRSARAREAVETLHAASGAQRLTSTIEDLAESYVHMHLNRLFRDEQRAHELVIYDFLVRLYEGLVARRRTSRS